MPYGTLLADKVQDSGNFTLSPSSVPFRNRIINGAMMIDQRNNGASVTPTSGQYVVDRWRFDVSQASKFTAQQNAGAVTPPAGYVNYLGATSSSAYSVLTGDYFYLLQTIEGLNVADLGWGTANASTVTLSFWVRSSLTGTFGGSLRNSALNRSYPFSYTISSANTWEQKTITIAGDTTGTWLTTNGAGIYLSLSLGAGSTYTGTAGSWAAANYSGATGQTSVVGTNGATFYITGVQLEKGAQATSFDYRPYGTELNLCYRYCFVETNESSAYRWFAQGYSTSTTATSFGRPMPVTMRTAPSGTFTAQNVFICDTPSGAATTSAVSVNGFTTATYARLNATATGLTTAQPMALGSDGVASLRAIIYSAEL